MNAVDGIRNRRSRRLYINSACAPVYLLINSKAKSARVPRRGAAGGFKIFGGTVKGGIRDALHRLQHYSEVVWIACVSLGNFFSPKYVKIGSR
jgi:hypothetical protein